MTAAHRVGPDAQSRKRSVRFRRLGGSSIDASRARRRAVGVPARVGVELARREEEVRSRCPCRSAWCPHGDRARTAELGIAVDRRPETSGRNRGPESRPAPPNGREETRFQAALPSAGGQRSFDGMKAAFEGEKSAFGDEKRPFRGERPAIGGRRASFADGTRAAADRKKPRAGRPADATRRRRPRRNERRSSCRRPRTFSILPATEGSRPGTVATATRSSSSSPPPWSDERRTFADYPRPFCNPPRDEGDIKRPASRWTRLAPCRRRPEVDSKRQGAWSQTPIGHPRRPRRPDRTPIRPSILSSPP